MVQFGGGRSVLLLGGDGVVLYGPSGAGVERVLALSWDTPQFDDLLSEALGRQGRNRPLVVLFDGADQTYRKEENIPKLSALDRPRFVRRKLDLAFPSYPIRASLEIKPPRTARRFGAAPPPSYLFVALPETDHVDRVGRSVLESGASVSGFALLPLESTGLVQTLAARTFAGGSRPARWAVLIGQHETGGLRQVVIKDGNLALTRLTPVGDAGTSGAEWAEEVMREFRATMSYISRFGYAAEDGIDVMIVSDDISRQFFTAEGMGTDRFRCLSVSDALKMIGAKSFGLEKSNYADALHAAWVSRRRGLNLPVRVPSLHRIMGPRLAAQGGGIVLAFMALGFVYATFSALQENYILSQELGQRQTQRVMLQREFEEESKIFDTLPVQAALLKGTLAVKTMLDKNTVPVKDITRRLKGVLGTDIYLRSLGFEHTPSRALPVSEQSATPAPVFGRQRGPDLGERGRVRVTFGFSLGRDMRLEDKVKRAEDLQKALLEAFPGYSVDIKEQFGRINREGRFEGTLSGDRPTAGGSGQNDIAVFEMEGPVL